jgi:hypothetical protein
LQDAISARNALNGHLLGTAILKIGFAKVPSRTEPITAQQALSQPEILASLASGAIERINTVNVWSSTNRATTNEVSIKESEQNASYGGISKYFI